MEIIACEKKPTFDLVYQNLYLGDIEAAKNQTCISTVDLIVNISNSRYKEYSKKSYEYFDIEDNRGANISVFFDRFVQIVEANLDKKILVHCANAVSRSVTLVLCYLIYKKMTLKDAILYLTFQRKQYTHPNIGFFKQLLDYEKKILGDNSLKVSDYLSVFA
ncbi:MAG TPA: dual specificity protein phosphatase [Saprospiraceae bacterium]|nr:dual specificity protein phosphatase [Saprospiraceae bacterium]